MHRPQWAIALFMAIVCLFANPVFSKSPVFIQKDSVPAPTKPAPAKKWYEKISLRGYSQIRYNRLLETNPDLKIEGTDRSIGDKGGLFLRRGRLVFSGDVHERVFIYIQPDYGASASATSLHFFQIRDAYFDLALDKKKEFRLRFGQSKVPFGFANMQSSSNRLTLDRDDALNSAVPNERDFGASFMWAPAKIRARFAHLANTTLKGSGDYGVFAFGVYNGQTMGRPEANNNLHLVGHLTWPFELKNGQFVEAGVHGYAGKFVLPTITKDVRGTTNYEYDDQRFAASLAIYPQPFGFQAEYNVGTGPQFDPAANEIVQKKLAGGYAQAMYSAKFGGQILTPFARYQWYEGGKKVELDARNTVVNEWEIGAEWQLSKNAELTVSYMISDRVFEDAAKPANHQKGNLLRLQMQFNY